MAASGDQRRRNRMRGVRTDEPIDGCVGLKLKQDQRDHAEGASADRGERHEHPSYKSCEQRAGDDKPRCDRARVVPNRQPPQMPEEQHASSTEEQRDPQE